MIPFRVTLQAGSPVFEQVLYAARKAMLAGQLRPGDAFPSVRALSAALKINPNTAHKVVQNLLNEGLLEVRPGIGTLVAPPPGGNAAGRGRLLNREVEALVVEAKHLGLHLEDVQRAVESHWKKLEAKA